MEISERYRHDVDRMLADHMKQQEQYAHRLVTLQPLQGRRKSSGGAAKRHAALPV
jgi:predicted transcriptional regulator